MEHEANLGEFMRDTTLELAFEFLKGYCRNEHIVAQVAHFSIIAYCGYLRSVDSPPLCCT